MACRFHTFLRCTAVSFPSLHCSEFFASRSRTALVFRCHDKTGEPVAYVEKAARISGGLGPYFVHTCAKEWHHCPFSQIVRAAPAPVPQRHLAVACWPSPQAAIMGLYRWAAWANPIDMAIANSATAKVFNMISSSLKTAKHAKGFDGPISSKAPNIASLI